MTQKTRRGRTAGELQALTQVAKTLASPVELHELLDAVMHTIIDVLEQADVGVIMLWDTAAGKFHPASSFGLDRSALDKIDLRAGEGITGKVFEQGQARLLSTSNEVTATMADIRTHNRQWLKRAYGSESDPKSAIAAPIIAGKQKFGTLLLESTKSQQKFTARDLPFIQTLADLIALAIERSRLITRTNAVRDARQVERMRSEVMATLSHELRMPLATIKGYATALMLDELNWSENKRSEFLGLIEEACNDMEGMLKDILDSAIIEVERLELQRQPLRLQHLARELAVEIDHRSQQHRPVVDFPTNFPIIEADSRWIKQVLRNVIDNAIKYSPEGGLIVIKGEVRPSDVVVSIADQGIGIPPEDYIPIFEKYFRLRAAKDMQVSGTGLGLPVARAVVEAHGGRIWVESKVGEGTTVYFSLPRQYHTMGTIDSEKTATKGNTILISDSQ